MGGAPCAICGLATRRESHSGFEFERCRACGYAALADERGKADYWGSHDANAEDEYWSRARRSYYDSALDLLETLARGRRLLDIGGGIGAFAERALARGWDAVSYDVSPSAREAAAARVGSERAWSSFDGAYAHSFDVVTMWCVVAHTRAPSELTALARRALAPLGRLWLTTPNFRFQLPYAKTRCWLSRPLDFAAHDHVGHFTAAAVEQLLRRDGFEEIRHHFRGITEACVAAGGSRNSALVGGKNLWNAIAFRAARRGLPNVMSELQVTARMSGS